MQSMLYMHSFHTHVMLALAMYIRLKLLSSVQTSAQSAWYALLDARAV